MADPISGAVAAILAVGTKAGIALGLSKGAALAAATFTVKAVALTGLSIATNLLLAPQVQGYGGSPSEWRADPDAPLPFVVGEFGLAGNIVYASDGYGPDNRFTSIVSVYTANGPVHSYGQMTLDDIPITFGGANGAASTGPSLWQGNIYLTRRTGLIGDTALASPPGLEGGASIPQWGSNQRLPGLGCSMLTLRGDNKNKRFPTGEPRPFQVLQAPAWSYDPRLDSTYPGGSGSHRRNDRTSWGYTTNPIIHALNFALGYWSGNGGFGDGFLIGGFGADWDNVDIESYIEAANIADTNEWKIGGLFTSADSKHEVHAAMLQAGGAVYANPQGKIGCVSRGAPKTSLLTVTDADLAGDIEIEADVPFRQKINSVIARCPLPSFKYEMSPLEAVTVNEFVTTDRGLRQRRIDMPMVPLVKQGGQLSAYAIVNSRERISGRFPAKPHLGELKPGDAFTLDLPGADISSLKVLCLNRQWNAEAQVWTITFQSETDSKHAFALGQDPTPPVPDTLTPGDPFDPLIPVTDEWTVTGGSLGNPGFVEQPVIYIEGGNEPAMASGVWIEYLEIGISPPQWVTWYKGEPSQANYEIAGILAGAEYQVRIAYANSLGYWTPEGDRLVIGPVTTGALVSGEALAAAPNSDLAEAIQDAQDAADQALVDAENALQEAGQVARDLRRDIDIEFSYLVSGLARVEDIQTRIDGQTFRRVERVRVVSEGAQATADSILTLTADPGSALITKLDLFEAQFAGSSSSGLLTNINTRATITQLNQAVADIFGASVSSFTQIAAEFSAVDTRIGDAEADIATRATISQLDEAEATADAATARAIQRLESSFAEAVGLFLSSIETTARENQSSARIVQRVSATTGDLSASVTDLSSAVTDLEEAVATRLITAEAGSAFAGLSFIARDSGGNLTSDIRFAAQIIAFGEDFDTPRFIIDMVGNEVYALNAAATVKTFQLDLETGRLRLRRADGEVAFDTDNGGIQINGVPVNTITASAFQDEVSTTPFPAIPDTGYGLTAVAKEFTKQLSSSTIELSFGVIFSGNGSVDTFVNVLLEEWPNDTSTSLGDRLTVFNLGSFRSLDGESRHAFWIKSYKGLAARTSHWRVRLIANVSGAAFVTGTLNIREFTTET